MRGLQGLCVIVATAIAVACGGAETAGSSAGGAGSLTATASGGTYTASGVTVVVPPGAVATDTVITITTDTNAPAGATLDGLVYHFAPEGLHFAVPISITLPGSNAAEVAYWTDDGSETSYSPQSTTYDGTGATLQVTHFSSGFVGTLPATEVTCTVQTPGIPTGSTCPVITTTVESPSFWFVQGPGGSAGGLIDGALATSSVGINRLFNIQTGDAFYYANAAHTIYDYSGVGSASVAGTEMTSFTANGGRGVLDAPPSCAPAVLSIACSGGNVVIHDYEPIPPTPDAGAPKDASISDASTSDATVNDATISDATNSDGSLSDASTGNEDSGAAVDAGDDSDADTSDAGSADASTPISWIQSAKFEMVSLTNVGTGYSTTGTAAFTNNVLQGDLIVAAATAYGCSAFSAQDSLGTTYSSRGPIFYALAAASGPLTVTLSMSSCMRSTDVPPAVYGTVVEYSGVTSLDGNFYRSYTSFASGSVTTNYDNELIVAFANITGQTGLKLSSGTGLNLRYSGGNTGASQFEIYDVLEDEIVGAAGSYSVPLSVSPTLECNDDTSCTVYITAFH